MGSYPTRFDSRTNFAVGTWKIYFDSWHALDMYNALTCKSSTDQKVISSLGAFFFQTYINNAMVVLWMNLPSNI